MCDKARYFKGCPKYHFWGFGSFSYLNVFVCLSGVIESLECGGRGLTERKMMNAPRITCLCEVACCSCKIDMALRTVFRS